MKQKADFSYVMTEHANQVLDWRKTAMDRTADKKDRASAIAALTRLDCWPAVEDQ